MGPALGNGVVPMRAECHFPDVDIDKMYGMMVAYGDHDLYWSSIVSSDVLQSDGSRTWVKQVHQAKGISNREAVLVMEKESVDGGFRYKWTLDNAGLEPASGHVAVAWDDDFWEITKHPEGGVKAVHQLAYGPGGNVPGFLVRWFQTSGLTAVVQEIEACAKK